jgi:hypothetical protein
LRFATIPAGAISESGNAGYGQTDGENLTQNKSNSSAALHNYYLLNDMPSGSL